MKDRYWDKKFSFFICFIFHICLIILTLNSYGQLNSINTINPAGTNFTGNPSGVAGKNYTSFTNAVTALTLYGVNSAVTFKIASGTYNEHISLNQIIGASSANTITFQSANMDSSSVIITYSATGNADNWTVKLNGSHYITFRNMTIKAQGNTYGVAFEIENKSDSNNFNNNIIQSVSSSSLSLIPIHSDNTPNQYNTIINNYITGGYYGIYLNYSTTTLAHNNIIESNIIKDFYYIGIVAYYQDAIKIRKNLVQNSIMSGTIYGLYANYCNNNIEITGNNFILKTISNCYGLYLSQDLGTSILRGKIANNFISIGSTSGLNIYGIYLEYTTYQNISFNSVNLYSPSVSSEAIYITSGISNSINLINNIFANFSGGYAIYIGTNTSLSNSDYNDLYTTGNNIGHWNSDITNLTAWQTASGKDINSVSANPGFFSQTDLHVNTVAISNNGIPISGIADDFDGDTRSITPDIGADEFNLTNNDAGVTDLASPLQLCTGINIIKIKVKNYGVAVLNSFILNWQINGVTQKLLTFISHGLAQYQDTIVVIDTFIFNTGISNNLKFWTSLPNGFADQNTLNDTFTFKNLRTGISGTYTIGSASSDYSSFNDAINDLINSGICGPVKFRVKAGNYNENINIPKIAGASATNTIIFESFNLDSTSVDLNYSASGKSDNYVIQFNGASYITFRLMKIRALGTNYGYAVTFIGGANNNNISNNIIATYPAAITTNFSCIYDNFTSLNNNNTIINNIIMGGYYGVYLSGINTSSNENHNIVQDNIIKDFYEYGIMVQYQNSPMISGNSLQNYPMNNVTNYGIYAYYIHDTIIITKNKIFLTGTSTNYGIYNGYNTGTQNIYGLIANNFTSIEGSVSNNIYGIYVYNCYCMNYYYNSINITGNTTGTSSDFYFSTSSTGNFGNINVKNNIAVNSGSGYAVYVDKGAVTNYYISISNYNDFYVTGTYLGHYGTKDESNLSAWFHDSWNDGSSVSINPPFVSDVDLHLTEYNVLRIYDPLPEITTDIDGDKRDSILPEIGADDFPYFYLNAAIKGITSPEKSSCEGIYPVTAKLYNYGASTIDSIFIDYFRNGTKIKTIKFVYPLQFYSDTTITVCYDTFHANINYKLLVRCRLPNNETDPYTNDDADSLCNLQFYSPPVITSTHNDTIYKNESATLSAAASSYHIFYWYDSPNSMKVLSEDSILKTATLNKSRTYYVNTSIPGKSDSIIVSKKISLSEMGNMFDIIAPYRDILIDSFAVNLTTGAGTNVPFVLYYRKGSYKGHEKNSPDWTLAGTKNVISKGSSSYTNIPLGSLWIKKGDTLGVYLSSADPATLINYSDGAGVFKDANLAINSGTINFYSFDPYFQSGKSWEGIIYYTKVSQCVSSTASVNAIVIPIIKLNLGNDTDICDGYHLVLDQGHFPAVSFLWKYGNRHDTLSTQPLIVVDSAGTYKLTVRDSLGDIQTDSLTVKVHPRPVVKFSVNDTSQCIKGNNFIFTDLSAIKSDTIIFYFWNLGDSTFLNTKNALHSYLLPGTFYVKLTILSDWSCQDSASVFVNVTEPPVVRLGNDTALFAGQAITLDAGAGCDSYDWSTGNKSRSIIVDSNGIGLNSKLFWVIIDKGGCRDTDSITITFKKDLGLNDPLKKSLINIFPNPSQSVINIEINKQFKTGMAVLSDIDGNEITRMPFSPQKDETHVKIDVSGLKSGIYFIKINCDSKTSLFRVIIN